MSGWGMRVLRFLLYLFLFFAGLGLLLGGIVALLLSFVGISFSIAVVLLLVVGVIALLAALVALPLKAAWFVVEKMSGALEKTRATRSRGKRPKKLLS